MGKVLILEGPDGGGKTTLAKWICTNANFDYKHEGPPPPGRDQLEYYKTVLYDALEADHNTVFDRLFLGEHIYGPVMRQSDRLTINGVKLFERIIASKSIWHYICMPSERTILDNFSIKIKDPNEYVKDIDNFKKVINGYYRMMLRPYNYVYDYESDPPQIVLDNLETDFKFLPKGMIGDPMAKYLFIADIPNHAYVDWPFFALNSSSGYFNNAIEIAGIKEHELALTNAFSPHMESHDPLVIYDSLPRLKHIFLMGTKAQEWFKCQVDSSIKVHFMSHPSYFRRFISIDPRVMANKIRREIWPI